MRDMLLSTMYDLDITALCLCYKLLFSLRGKGLLGKQGFCVTMTEKEYLTLTMMRESFHESFYFLWDLRAGGSRSNNKLRW